MTTITYSFESLIRKNNGYYYDDFPGKEIIITPDLTEPPISFLFNNSEYFFIFEAI